MKKIKLITLLAAWAAFTLLTLPRSVRAQVVTDVKCEEKNLAPVRGPVPYGPRKVAPPDYDLPADPKPQPVHKGVDLQVWHNSPDKFLVGGMALLANGDMLELDYDGELYLVSGLAQAATVKRTALPSPGFTQPLGLLVKDRTVYVNTANSIWSYVFDGTSLTQQKELLKIPKRSGWYGWNCDFASDSAYLYAGLGTRGSIGRYEFKTGKWDLDFVTAFRNSNGMGSNDSGAIWITDNQGHYRPATPIFLMKAGKSYGVPTQNGTTGSANWGSVLGPAPDLEPYKSDMLWIPYDQMSHSATDIHFMKSGPFKGQALVGDNRTGHLNRLIFDKVDGQTQGTAIRMTGGLEAPTYRIVEDDKGNIYLGGLGYPSNIYWVWCGKSSGFQKLTFKADFIGNKAYNDVLGVSLVKDGLLVSFTSDINDEFLAAANYRAYTFSYIKSISPYYGGPKSDSAETHITSIVKRSNRDILLSIPGLQKETMLGIEFGSKLTLGANLQSYEMFYTVNHLSDRIPTDIGTPAERVGEPRIESRREGRFLHLSGLPASAADIRVTDATGKSYPGLAFARHGTSGELDISPLPNGVYFLRIAIEADLVVKPFVIR